MNRRNGYTDNLNRRNCYTDNLKNLFWLSDTPLGRWPGEFAGPTAQRRVRQPKQILQIIRVTVSSIQIICVTVSSIHRLQITDSSVLSYRLVSTRARGLRGVAEPCGELQIISKSAGAISLTRGRFVLVLSLWARFGVSAFGLSVHPSKPIS